MASRNDNNGTIPMGVNSVTTSNSKHIDIRHHFLRNLVGKREFETTYTPSNYQHTDFLTEPFLLKMPSISRRISSWKWVWLRLRICSFKWSYFLVAWDWKLIISSGVVLVWVTLRVLFLRVKQFMGWLRLRLYAFEWAIKVLSRNLHWNQNTLSGSWRPDCWYLCT